MPVDEHPVLQGSLLTPWFGSVRSKSTEVGSWGQGWAVGVSWGRSLQADGCNQTFLPRNPNFVLLPRSDPLLAVLKALAGPQR